MSKELKDFSQLTKSILKKGGPNPVAVGQAKAEPVPSPVKTHQETAASDAPQMTREEAECLEYFSHTSLSDSRFATAGRAKTVVLPKKVAAPAGPKEEGPDSRALEERVSRLEEELKLVREEKAEAVHRAEKAESDLQESVSREKDLVKSVQCLTHDLDLCRCQIEAHEPATDAVVEEHPVVSPVAEGQILLELPDGLEEMFPGEGREMVLAALQDAQKTAESGSRDRRAAVLASVLSANQVTGELDRRRAELRQILKDAGSFNDEQTLKGLEKLGIKMISGRKHWKLEYGNIRMPMSKTPSDWRSTLNTASDMANRCF